MSNFTFLTEEQCFGADKLYILKKRGTKAAISDFSILLGGAVTNYEHIEGDSSLEGRTGYYWTKTSYNNDARVVYCDGISYYNYVRSRGGGVRPVLPFSLISLISSNEVRGNENVFEVEFGEYPKSVVSKEVGNILEKLYNSNSLSKTGKSYTTDSRNYDEYDKKFEAQSHIEYEYNGRKYVRVKARFCDNPTKLSNGEEYKYGDYVWVMVEPIKWLVDKRNDIAITKDIIVSGIQFKYKRDYQGDFNTTDIKKFMDEYLSKEIIQHLDYEIENKNNKNKIDLSKINSATYEDTQNLIKEAEEKLEEIKRLSKIL